MADPAPSKGKKRGRSSKPAANKFIKRRTSSPLKQMDLGGDLGEPVAEIARSVHMAAPTTPKARKRGISVHSAAMKVKSQTRRRSSRLRKLDRAKKKAEKIRARPVHTANPSTYKATMRGKSAKSSARKLTLSKRRRSSRLSKQNRAENKADVDAEKIQARPVHMDDPSTSKATKRAKSAKPSTRKLTSSKRRTSNRLRNPNRTDKKTDVVAEKIPARPIHMADPTTSKAKNSETSADPFARKFTLSKSSTSSRLRKLDRAAYKKLTVFNAPCKLVENGPDGKLKICDEVLKELRQIESPLNIISITGPYRTGKSYILNYLAGKRKGFPLGSTVLAETKGIWVWCQPHPKRHDEVLLLLDTEGLGDIMKGDAENDTWIFTLSVLLSSTLVYNCKSSINQDGLSQLHYVTELTKRIKQGQASKDEDGSEFFTFFPNFVWIVRDFTLDLKDKEGKPITSDQYLLDALELKEDETPNKDDYNRPRQCILQYFADTKCFVFPPPVNDWRNCNELERLSDSQLDSKFLQEAKEFCSYIYIRSFPKTAECQPIQGKMFCDLLETYLQSIKRGDIPCVENAVKRMAEKENADAVEASFNVYKDLMKKTPLKSINTEKELIDEHLRCYGKAIDTFMSMSILDEKGKYQEEMKENISQKFKQILEEWKQHHRESESVNGDPELEYERKLATFKELHQEILKLQKKVIQEQKNRIHELERWSDQRHDELTAIRKNTSWKSEKKEDLLNILCKQVNLIDLNKENTESGLKAIIQGGASFGNYLVRAERITGGMSAGAALGRELGALSGNPIVMVVLSVLGCIIGGFHEFQSTQNLGMFEGSEPSFEDGMVIGNPDLQTLGGRRDVCKFGRSTGLTEGLLALENAMLKVHSAKLSLEYGMTLPPGYHDNTFLMKGQFLIQNVGNSPFFTPGDSGAGVYVVRRNQQADSKLALIGIAIGSLTSGECVMTPIGRVLEALGLKESDIITEGGMETNP